MRKKKQQALLKDNKDTRLYVDSLRSEVNYLSNHITKLDKMILQHSNILKAAGIIEALELNEDYIELSDPFGKSLYKINEVF